MIRVSKLALAALVLVCSYGCAPLGGETSLSDSPSYATEGAIALINSVTNESERGPLLTVAGELTPLNEPSVRPMAQACGSFNPRSTCNSANQITVDWDDCFFPFGDGRMHGGWLNTYNNTAACSQAQTGPLQSGQSVTRTSGGLEIEGYYGGTLTFDTNAHSTYDTTTIPSTGITVTNNGSSRTIYIGGAHRVLRDKDGATLFDLSLITPSSLMVTGTKAMGNRTLLDTGSVRIYNNTDEYRATVTFDNLKWANNTCCYPTQGTVSTAFSGSKSGVSKLEFNGVCASAEYTDTDGSQSTIKLVQCE
jgi:hypothetical protein